MHPVRFLNGVQENGKSTVEITAKTLQGRFTAQARHARHQHHRRRHRACQGPLRRRSARPRRTHLAHASDDQRRRRPHAVAFHAIRDVERREEGRALPRLARKLLASPVPQHRRSTGTKKAIRDRVSAHDRLSTALVALTAPAALVARKNARLDRFQPRSTVSFAGPGVRGCPQVIVPRRESAPISGLNRRPTDAGRLRRGHGTVRVLMAVALLAELAGTVGSAARKWVPPQSVGPTATI